MNHLSTRELLCLEDTSKLFESIEKACSHAARESGDEQIRNLLNSVGYEHKQWIQATAALGIKGPMQ